MSIETEGCSGRTRPAIDGAPAETRKAPNVDNFRIALAQVNTIVGDLRGNTELIKGWIDRASALGADLAAFPELTLTGYPPEDLVLYPSFVAENRRLLQQLAVEVKHIAAIVGFVDEVDGRLFNALALIANGEVQGVYHKIHLPNYGVFDERRYFVPGAVCPVANLGHCTIGFNVCEDIWQSVGPSEIQCQAGAELIVNINGSPFEIDKRKTRKGLVTSAARRNRAFVAYVNQVGGQDELVFDGGSMVAGPDGNVIASSPQFEEDLLVIDLDIEQVRAARRESPVTHRGGAAAAGTTETWQVRAPKPKNRPAMPPPRIVEADILDVIYSALVVGTRDYVRKTGFGKVAVALSGGVDSSLVAAVAVDALGAPNVVGVSMPSRYSSDGSRSDAVEMAKRLGIDLWHIPIEAGHVAFEEMLAPYFAGTDTGVAEENVQARIRGNLMMAISNKFGWLVLTTGNKSEMATGYATLYGDMAGGFAVIKDVPKTLVYELARHRNEFGPGSPIPQAVIDKPPSAELRPDQLDEDSLPPYAVLDRILEMYVEEREPIQHIIDSERAIDGERADEATVRRIARLVDRNEYKRRQAAPGVKITGLAFGRDRRLPLASQYRE